MRKFLSALAVMMLIAAPFAHSAVIKGDPDKIRIVVETDKMDYAEGDPISIIVSIKNDSDTDAKLEFPTPLQIDYEIDDGVFRYSDHIRFFAQMVTYIDIPAGGKEIFTFTHSPEQFPLRAGGHYIRASIVDTKIEGYWKFMVGEGSTPQPRGLYLSVSMPKSDYYYKEPIEIIATAINDSDTDVTFQFPTSLQLDYFIDGGAFHYADSAVSAQVVTSVTIPAGEKYEWKLTHDPELYTIKPGGHDIRVQIVGTEYSSYAKFFVSFENGPLPEGLELSVATSKPEYDMSEIIAFTLTVTNTTNSDIVLMSRNDMPIKYTISRFYDDLTRNSMETYLVNDGQMESYIPEFDELIIPAGGSKTFEGQSFEKRLLPSGRYMVYAGLRYYKDEAAAPFVIKESTLTGSISGTVVAYATDFRTMLNVEGARVTLTDCVRDIKILDAPDSYRGYGDNKSGDGSVSGQNGSGSDSFAPDYEPRIVLETTTDANGQFRFDDVKLFTNYSITVEKDGYVSYATILYTCQVETIIQPALKKYQEPVQDPINFISRSIGDLKITMGTGRYIFESDDYFKGYFSITNGGVNPVTFKFDNDTHVTWTLYNAEGTVIWTKEGAWIDSTSVFASEEEPDTMTIEPGGIREFYCLDNIGDMIPDSGDDPQRAIYVFGVSLTFTSASSADLTPENVGGNIKIAVVSSTFASVEVNSMTPEYVVDLKDSLKTVLDMKMNAADVNGAINVSEVRQNIYKPLDNHRFIKMVAVDADETIRSNMKNALIRIYFDPDECENPEKLVIAHWRENMHTGNESYDESDMNKWQILNSHVDLTNNFVEAETTDFSSFGLFENTAATAVEEESPQVFSLAQNSPNPFNPTTTIAFTLPSSGQVKLTVYNMTGQEVARLVDGYMAAGSHNAVFGGEGLASGVYFYRIVAGGHTATKRMLLIK